MPTKIVPAKAESLDEVIEFISAQAEALEFAPKRVFEIQLAVEEAFVNIANYAYPDKDGSVEVSCETDGRGALVITLIDSGLAFDLLSASAPTLEDDVSQREVGGLGIFLIKKVMDDVSYKRLDGKNVLTLTAGQR